MAPQRRVPTWPRVGPGSLRAPIRVKPSAMRRVAFAIAIVGLLGLAAWWGTRRPAPRAPKTMTRDGQAPSAGRTQTATPGSSAEAAPTEVVATTLQSMFLDVATGVMAREDETALVEQLREALALEGWGDVRNRHAQAKAAVAELFRRAEGAPITDEDAMTALQRRAIAETARAEAQKLKRALTASNAPTTPLPSGHQPVRWSTLTDFAFTPGMTLPSTVTSLDGAKVAVDGYMLVLERDDDRRIRAFLLLESLWGCCFARTPAIHEGIAVRMTTPRGITGHEGPITVLGTLAVGEEREEGEVTSVYRLQAADVKPLSSP